MRALFPFLALTLLALPASAEMYKWTDANGNTHFGDRPPSHADAKRMNPSPATTIESSSDSSVNRQQKVQEFLEERQREREQRRQEQERQEAKARKQQKRCQRLAARLKDMKRMNVVYKLDENGERQYYSEEKKQALIERRRRAYEENCTS